MVIVYTYSYHIIDWKPWMDRNLPALKNVPKEEGGGVGGSQTHNVIKYDRTCKHFLNCSTSSIVDL